MPSRPYAIALHIALITLGALTVLLAQQNRHLRQVLNPPPPPVQTGQLATPVELLELDGATRTLDFQGAPRDHLIFVFTTTCPACKENQTHWSTLHASQGSDLDIVAISLDNPEATAKYRDEHGLAFDVATAADRRAFIDAFDVGGVPFTLHIGADGRVMAGWRGLLSEARIAEVQDHLRSSRRG